MNNRFLKYIVFTILLFVLSYSAFSYEDYEDYVTKETYYQSSGEKGFRFKINDNDLDFYREMRGRLKVSGDMTVIPLEEGLPGVLYEYSIDRFDEVPYKVHELDEDSYRGYQFTTDVVKADPNIPDNYYNIDNYDIYLNMLDDLDKNLKIDLDYFTDTGTKKEPIDYELRKRKVGDDIILDIIYDATGITGNLIDQLDLIVVDDRDGVAKSPSTLWSHVSIHKRPIRPKTRIFINDGLIITQPTISKAYAYPHAPTSLTGQRYIFGPPVVNVSISEVQRKYYYLSKTYKNAGKYVRHGAPFEFTVEISPYVFNIWAVPDNIVFSDYAAGFTSATRFKFIDERKFNMFLGVRSGYMYAFTSPVMFNIPMFAELGLTAGFLEIYVGAGTVYSGAYYSNFIPAIEAGIGINIDISRQDKFMLGVNANLAKGLDGSDIKFIELYSSQISPYIGFKHSFSYWESKPVTKSIYAAVEDNQEGEKIFERVKKRKIDYEQVSEAELKKMKIKPEDLPVILDNNDIKNLEKRLSK